MSINSNDKEALQKSSIKDNSRLNKLKRTLYVALGYSLIHVGGLVGGNAEGAFDWITSIANVLVFEYIIYLCFHAWLEGEVKPTQKVAVLTAGITSMLIMGWGTIIEADGAQGSKDIYLSYLVPSAGIIGALFTIWIFSSDPVKMLEVKRKMAANLLKIKRQMTRIKRANLRLKLTSAKDDLQFEDLEATFKIMMKEVRGGAHAKKMRRSRAMEAAKNLIDGNQIELQKLIPEPSTNIQTEAMKKRLGAGGDGVGESQPLPEMRINPKK